MTDPLYNLGQVNQQTDYQTDTVYYTALVTGTDGSSYAASGSISLDHIDEYNSIIAQLNQELSYSPINESNVNGLMTQASALLSQLSQTDARPLYDNLAYLTSNYGTVGSNTDFDALRSDLQVCKEAGWALGPDMQERVLQEFVISGAETLESDLTGVKDFMTSTSSFSNKLEALLGKLSDPNLTQVDLTTVLDELQGLIDGNTNPDMTNACTNLQTTIDNIRSTVVNGSGDFSSRMSGLIDGTLEGATGVMTDLNASIAEFAQLSEIASIQLEETMTLMSNFLDVASSVLKSLNDSMMAFARHMQ